jgi:hypothetical protein
MQDRPAFRCHLAISAKRGGKYWAATALSRPKRRRFYNFASIQRSRNAPLPVDELIADYIAGKVCKRGKYIFVWIEQDLLFPDDRLAGFNRRHVEVVRCTRMLVEEAFRQLYPPSKCLWIIHNDLRHGNVNVYHRRLSSLYLRNHLGIPSVRPVCGGFISRGF